MAILQPLKKAPIFIYLRHIVTLVLKYINRNRLFSLPYWPIFSHTQKNISYYLAISQKRHTFAHAKRIIAVDATQKLATGCSAVR